MRRVGFEMLDHLPYLPYLASSNFHLFPKLKKYIHGTKFDDEDTIMAVVIEFLKAKKKNFFWWI